MQCPKCASNNPAQARFCMACGTKLVADTVCSRCHTLLPLRAIYCYHCGAYLGAVADITGIAVQPLEISGAVPSPVHTSDIQRIPSQEPPATFLHDAQAELEPRQRDEMRDTETRNASALQPSVFSDETKTSLRRYLPDALYTPLERRHTVRDLHAISAHLSGLLRTIETYLPLPVVLSPQPVGCPDGQMQLGTFVFADVSGFTPLSERLRQFEDGAERIAAIMNRLFTELVQQIFDFGGTLLKFGGDALLGLFPADDDADLVSSVLRATHAALAMLRTLEQPHYQQINAAGEIHSLKIKCGIAAGPYFAAHIGIPPNARDSNGTMAYVTTGSTVNQAEIAEGFSTAGQATITHFVRELLGERVRVMPIAGDATGEFHHLLEVVATAPPVAIRPSLDELKEGDPETQIEHLLRRLNLLVPYLSDELVDRLRNSPSEIRIAPEYRPVTVMFVNYRGISSLVEKLGAAEPGVITDRLNSYFSHMAELVRKYEGTLARMDQYAVGDRLVIFFGAPRAHEDDPIRAVMAALEMQEAVRVHFSALRTSVGVFRFEQRIGINTGYLFAGNAGAADIRQEYTLMGDDINTAARLMSNARWGSIYISHKTAERTQGLFELGDQFLLQVKGKTISIPTYRVLGRKGEHALAPMSSQTVPFIGRDAIIGQLKVRVEALLQSQRGQIVSITGESGLGKSRLKQELAAWLAERFETPRALWIEARALSFSEQTSYWLAAQLLRASLMLPANAESDEALYALWEKGESLLKEETMEVVPFLAHMMGLELGQEWKWVRDLAPQIRQNQTLWAAQKYFGALARELPLILILEDLHWADEASLTLLHALLEISDTAPVMLILIFRPLRDKACWGLRDRAASRFPHRYTEIQLAPLSRVDSSALVAALLPGVRMPVEVTDNLLNRAAGNPLYLEEVTRYLVDRRLVIPDPMNEGRWSWVETEGVHIEIPDTLQATIVARIDRLTEDGRQALQTASVIGKQFQLSILRSLVRAEAELDSWLAQLERTGLIHPEHALDADYTFPDALVQEVAYSSLLVNTRRTYHRRIGEVLESLNQSSGSLVELLAYHFGRSDEPERAQPYLELAAQRARANYANLTALRYYKDLLALQQRSDSAAGQAKTLFQMGIISYEIGDYDSARMWLEQARDLSQHADDAAQVGWSTMYLGMLHLKQGNYDAAHQHHTKALAAAKARNDTFQLGIHMTNAARVLLRLGAYDRALRLLSESLELKRMHNDLTGVGFAFYYIGIIQVYQERYILADESLERALESWAEVPNNERLLAFYHQGKGMIALATQNYPQALQHFQQSLATCEKLVLRAETIENLSFLGNAYLYLGEPGKALQHSSRAIELLTAQKDVEEIQQILYTHYLILSVLGQEDAAHYLEQALAVVDRRANLITNADDRALFLEGVPVNRAIRLRANPACSCAIESSP